MIQAVKYKTCIFDLLYHYVVNYKRFWQHAYRQRFRQPLQEQAPYCIYLLLLQHTRLCEKQLSLNYRNAIHIRSKHKCVLIKKVPFLFCRHMQNDTTYAC